MRVLCNSLRFPIIAVSLFLSVVQSTEARAQDPIPDPIAAAAAAAAASAPAPDAPPADGSPVVRAVPNNYGMTFSFGGLGAFTANGLADQTAGKLLFTEIGFRAVLSSVTIPFSVGL